MSNGADSKSPIETAVAVLGVTAGLTAVAYFVGSVAIWLRLYISHFPADIGLELASDGRIIAVGVRGIAVVAGIVALLLLMVRVLASYFERPARRSVRNITWIGPATVLICLLVLGLAFRVSPRTFLSIVSLLFVLAAVALMLPPSDASQRVWALGFGLMAFVISAFVGWRLFGLVVATLSIGAVIGFTGRKPQVMASNWGVRRIRWKVPWWVNVVIVALVALAAISWQVNTPVSIATIRALPLVNPDLPENPALPYFGSSGDSYYVACLVEQTDPDSNQPYEYLRPIVEVPRDDLTYVEFGQSNDLYPKIKTPAAFAWDWIQVVWHGGSESDAIDHPFAAREAQFVPEERDTPCNFS